MYDNNYLAHYGIRGQRWGVRRFQNEDGTLTNAGKRKFAKDEKKQLIKDNKSKKILNKSITKNGKKVENKNYDPEARKRVSNKGKKAVAGVMLAVGARKAATVMANNAQLQTMLGGNKAASYTAIAAALGLSSAVIGATSAASFVGRNKAGYDTSGN